MFLLVQHLTPSWTVIIGVSGMRMPSMTMRCTDWTTGMTLATIPVSLVFELVLPLKGFADQ